MLLKLCAMGAAMVPYGPKVTGQLPRYVNRTKDGKSWPANDKPQEFDSEKIDPRLFAKLAKRCRQGALAAYDEATARELGVDFKLVLFSDGVWSPTVPVKDETKSQKRASAGGKD